MTLEYVKDRKLRRPIGSYQALKHRLADMLLWLESAKAVTVAALDAVESDAAHAEAASVAKATSPTGARRSSATACRCTAGSASPGSTTCTCSCGGRVERRDLRSPDHHRDRLARAVGF